MIVAPERVQELIGSLRDQPGFEDATLESGPEPLSGGFWASISRLTLTGASLPADRLVLRVMPDEAMAAKEALIQGEVCRQGFPVPAIRLAGDRASVFGAPFILMDEAPGRTAIADLNGLSAVRHLHFLGVRLPVLLAEVATRLHRLDPDALKTKARASRLAAPWTAEAFLGGIAMRAEALGHTDLQLVAEWMKDHPPPSNVTAICHGDLHPLNLLIAGDRWTLLDWTTALVADPAYDIAFTALMLRHPPMIAPPALQPFLGIVGAWMAARFLRSYERMAHSVPNKVAVAWYTSFHALRALVELEGWKQEPDSGDHRYHPWTILESNMRHQLRTHIPTMSRSVP